MSKIPKTVGAMVDWITSLQMVEPLDIYVEDQKCQEALQINNRGLDAQVEYLEKRYGSLAELHKVVLHEHQQRIRLQLVTQHKQGLGQGTILAKGHPAYKRQKRSLDKKDIRKRLAKSMKRLRG